MVVPFSSPSSAFPLPPQAPDRSPEPGLVPVVQLDHYTLPETYTPGAPLWKQLLWYFIGAPFVTSKLLPFSGLKVRILRWFGANLGQGIRIKPGMRVKFPWRLTVGDHCWIGEQVWIDNLAPVQIEDHVCLSQGVYLCTGNHDWGQPTFDLRTGEIHIQSGSWLGAKSVVGPGVTVSPGAVLTLGSVAIQSLNAMTIYSGNPAIALKSRVMKPQSDETYA